MRLEEGDRIVCKNLQEMLETVRDCHKSGGEVVLETNDEERILVCTKSTRIVRIIRKT